MYDITSGREEIYPATMILWKQNQRLFVSAFLIFLNIYNSIQTPLQTNVFERDRQIMMDHAEDGHLTDENFEDANEIPISNDMDHDEDLSSDLFEGDVILNDEERAALEDGIDLREVVQSHKKWSITNGIVKVPYTFPSGLDRATKAEIAKVIKEFKTKTCIRYTYLINDLKTSKF